MVQIVATSSYKLNIISKSKSNYKKRNCENILIYIFKSCKDDHQPIEYDHMHHNGLPRGHSIELIILKEKKYIYIYILIIIYIYNKN